MSQATNAGPYATWPTHTVARRGSIGSISNVSNMSSESDKLLPADGFSLLDDRLPMVAQENHEQAAAMTSMAAAATADAHDVQHGIARIGKRAWSR